MSRLIGFRPIIGIHYQISLYSVLPTTADAKIAEEAYEKIEKLHEAAEGKEPRRGESQSAAEEKDPGLSIDLDLPGVDAGVDVQIGPNGVQIDTKGVSICFLYLTDLEAAYSTYCIEVSMKDLINFVLFIGDGAEEIVFEEVTTTTGE